MATLKWDDLGSKVFETGISHGVFYPPRRAGVPWNGLVRVAGSSEGGELKSYYMDGFKFNQISSSSDFTADIEAYTYPSEFEAFDGMVEDGNGLIFGQQPRGSFGLSYQTRIGNDVQGLDLGFKIHIVYNATVEPSTKEYETLGDSPEAETFSWTIKTIPEHILGRSPTAYMVIDSRKTSSQTLKAVTDILYGTSTSAPRLPTGSELAQLFIDWNAFQINERLSTGLATLTPEGHDDLTGNMDRGLYKATSTTRLAPQLTDGLYRLG